MRSDQYRFVRQGVPAVYLLSGVNRNIARAVATQKERPAWNHGDFSGDKFGRNR